MAKRIISFIISLLLLTSAIISCGDDSNAIQNETSAAADTAAEETDPLAARRAVADDLPEANLDGAEWRVYTQEAAAKKFYTDTEDGEVVNDAIFYANRAVEERFNADLVVTINSNDDYAQPAAIQKLVATGDSTYSLVNCHDLLGTNLALANNFVNLADIEYLNFDKPWWHNMDDITVLDKVYMISSDMTILTFKLDMVNIFK